MDDQPIEITKKRRNEVVKELDYYLEDTKKAKKLEQSIYDFQEEYCDSHDIPYMAEHIYEDKVGNIINNFDEDEGDMENEFLLDAICSDKVKPEDVAFLSPQELHPELYRAILQKQKYKEDKLNNLATTNLYTCSKCKDNRHTVYQMQTRSADEPMTTFVKCQTCGFTFKT